MGATLEPETGGGPRARRGRWEDRGRSGRGGGGGPGLRSRSCPRRPVDLPGIRCSVRCHRLRRRAQRQQRQGRPRRCGSCPARAAGERHLRRREHGIAGAEARARSARRRGGRRVRRRRAAGSRPDARALRSGTRVRSRRTGFRGSLRAVGYAGRGRLGRRGRCGRAEARAVGLHEGARRRGRGEHAGGGGDGSRSVARAGDRSADRPVVPRAGARGEPEARRCGGSTRWKLPATSWSSSGSSR